MDQDEYVYIMRLAWYAWQSGYNNNPSNRLRCGINNTVMAVMSMVRDRACDLDKAERVIADIMYQVATGTVPVHPPTE